MKAEEGLLEDVLREGPISQEVLEEGQHVAGVALVEEAEGRTAGRAQRCADQGRVVLLLERL